MPSPNELRGNPAARWNWQRGSETGQRGGDGETGQQQWRDNAGDDVRRPLLPPPLHDDDDTEEARPVVEDVSLDLSTSANTPCGPGCSLSSTIATLTMGVLGTGQLALPFALSRVGLYAGVVCLGMSALFALATLQMLSACKLTAADYGDLLRAYLGSTAAHAANLLLALYAWGGGVTYLMILAKELVAVLDHIAGDLAFKLSTNAYLCAAVLLLVLPLSCTRHLDRLKFTSTFGACAAVYITLVVTGNAFWGLWSGDAPAPCQGRSQPECECNSSCESDADNLSAGFNLFPVLLPPAGQDCNDTASHFSLMPDFEGLPM